MVDFFQEPLKAGVDSFTGDTESVSALKEWVRVYQVRRTEKNFLDRDDRRWKVGMVSFPSPKDHEVSPQESTFQEDRLRLAGA